MGAHDARERLIADSQFGGGATSWAPATWYLALSLTIPNDDGSGFTEPVGNGYARPPITNNVANFPAATTVAGETFKVNGTKFTFANPTGAWGSGPILYYGFFDVLSGGICAYSNPLDSPITVRAGNTPVEFDLGQLVMSFS